MSERSSVACPHPECEGTLNVPDWLPGGDYPCICHACTVHLLWVTSLEKGKYPMVSLVAPPARDGGAA